MCAEFKARLAAIETRLREVERQLEIGRERDALGAAREVRSQLDEIFVALLLGHLNQLNLGDATKPHQEFEALFRQLLDIL